MKKKPSNKCKSQNVQKQAAQSVNILVVADAGPDADFRTEPRHYFQVPLDFTLSRRSSARQLAGLINLACWRVPNGLSAGDCHVWLLDEDGQPSFFLSGLLAVRKGKKTKKEVEAHNKRLVPQITTEQPQFECNLLASAAANVVSYDHEYDDDVEVNTEEIEYDLLEAAVGHFDYSALIDSSFEEGVSAEAEDEWELKSFESVSVTAEIGSKAAITLPFDPSCPLSLPQQRYVHAKVTEALLESIDADFEPEVFDVELWLTDDSGSPSLYLTGLLDVLEGRLSKRKLKQATERARAVSYKSKDVEQKVLFTGTVIAISNVPLRSDPLARALGSRIVVLEHEPTDDEIAAFIRKLANDGYEDLSADKCIEVAEFVIDETRQFDLRLDLRHLTKAWQDFRQHKHGRSRTSWRDLVRTSLKKFASEPIIPFCKKDEIEAQRQKVREAIRRYPNDRSAQITETGLKSSTFYNRLKEVQAEAESSAA